MSETIPTPKTKGVHEPMGSRLRKDTVAGLINAVVSVPDGLASAALAGVNPVYGLYTSIAAPISGSLTRVGATLVLDQYADDLAEVGGRLYLSGVDDDVS